jgi:flagellar hook-basal body complex protein FliE
VGFSDLLEAGIRKTNELAHVAEAKAEAFASGRLDDLHGTMISAKEAEISLRLVGTVRTKLLDAFHELWRINV